MPLAASAGLIFKGSNPLGTGFQLGPDAARRMLAEHSANADVVRPLYGADDVTKLADLATPGRWIIDFGGRSLEEAETYRAPMEVVRRLVKPEREALDDHGQFKVRRKAYRERWWQLAERSARLYEVVGELDPVIAIPEVSKTMLPVFVPGKAVYLQTMFVVASNDPALFGLLSSSFHWLWAALPTHATSLESRPRYHQARCFGTFPQPGLTDALRKAGQTLNEHRAAVMRTRSEGLTKVYNLVTDPSCVDIDIEQLRECHGILDHAIADAYGWLDLTLDHDVRPHRRFGPRWLPDDDAQREIERRLLQLNRERARVTGHAAPLGAR